MGRRFAAGCILLGIAVLLPFAALLFPVLGLPSASSSFMVSLLVAGVPELLCLGAIALLGRAGLQSIGAKMRRESETVTVSKIRYYSGLILCLLNTLPITLYAYAPAWMPGGIVRLCILVMTDLGFVLSLFFMGGEFWEKFRRLFIWEGKMEAYENTQR